MVLPDEVEDHEATAYVIVENNENGISICVNHRYRDKHICLPMNTPSYKHISPALCALAGVVTKEEDIGPMEMVVSEGGNISDSTADAYTDKPSPDLILSDKHELSHIKERTSPKRIQMIKRYFVLSRI